MASRWIRGPLIFNTTFTVTTGNYTVVNESVVFVNKTVGAATTITLPGTSSTAPVLGQSVFVIDQKGDAGTNNITVQGGNSATINGASTKVLASNFAAALFVWNGTEWDLTVTNVPSILGNLPATTFSGNVTMGAGTYLLESDSATVSAAGTNQGGATALTSMLNRITTCAANAGVILPANVVGMEITVTNNGANTCNVYPDSGAAINGLGTNNATPLPVNGTATFYCIASNVWVTLPVPPRAVNTAINTVGAGTLTAAGIVGGLITRGGSQSNTNFSDATDSAANIVAALHGAVVNQSWELTIENTTNALMTITNGTGVTVSGITTIPSGTSANYLVTVTASATVTMVGYATAFNSTTSLTQQANAALTTGTVDAQTYAIQTSNTTRWTWAAASANVTLASAADMIAPAATASAFRVTDGTNPFIAVDTRVATDNTSNITLGATGPSYASAAGSTHSLAKANAYTLTLTGGTGVTALGGLSVLQASPTVTSGSATTVTTASAVQVNGPLPAGSVTFTNSFALDIPTFATNGTTAAGLRVAAPTGSGTNLGIQVTSGGMTVAGGLTVTPTTAAAITTTRALTAADSGGTFSVAKTSAYAITLPTPAQGLRFKFMVLDAGANAVTISDSSAHLFGDVSVNNVNTSLSAITTITLVATGDIGDWIEIVGIDATHYMVTGACKTAAKMTFA